MPSERIAFYGGSFDPVHIGHIEIARRLIVEFSLDRFVFIPAFHAPHKPERKPTSAYDRYAMLCLATANDEQITVSRIELDRPERPYTVETLTTLKEKHVADDIFFVMGADSWRDILTWREWEKVLLMVNHIVVTRPGYEIDTAHVSPAVRSRVVDRRDAVTPVTAAETGPLIYFSGSVHEDISSTAIRQHAAAGDPEWEMAVPPEVAKYIKKYQIYK